MLPLGKNFGIALPSCQTQRSYKTIDTTGDVNLTDQNFINYYAQQSCSKVMFSQASVSHSVHMAEGGVWQTPWVGTPQADTSQPSACWDTHTPCPMHAGKHTPPAQCMLGYTLLLPSACWDTHTPLPSACWDTLPPHPPTPADGTHPTGMHSCYIGILKLFVELAHYPPPPPTPS